MEKTFACGPSATLVRVDVRPFLPLVSDVALTPGGKHVLPAQRFAPGVTLEGCLRGVDGGPVGASSRPLPVSPDQTELREI